MGSLSFKNLNNYSVSLVGQGIDGIYIVQPDLINGKKYYKGTGAVSDFFITWSNPTGPYPLGFWAVAVFTPIYVAPGNATFPWQQNWNTPEGGYISLSPININNNKTSIKKQNLGGGRTRIKRNDNLFTCPFNMDTTECPSPSPINLNNSGWFKGGATTLIGKTIAPDGSNTAVEYQSNLDQNSYISQGYFAYWKPNTKYIFSVWAKKTAGNPTTGNIMTITRNNISDRVSLNISNITSEWKYFSIEFTTGSDNLGFYTTAFFGADMTAGTRIALWGADLYIPSYA